MSAELISDHRQRLAGIGRDEDLQYFLFVSLVREHHYVRCAKWDNPLPGWHDLPVADSAPFIIKVDAHFHDGKSALGETCGVVLEVNLLHGSSCRLVYFQFKEIQCLVRAHHHVHTASGCAHLHVNVFILCQ